MYLNKGSIIQMLVVENLVGSEKNKEKKDHWEIDNP